MNPLTTIKLAIRALWRNRVRTLLTMLGIVIGIAAVITMVSFGQGAQAQVRDVFASLGTNVLQVSSGATRGGPSGGAGSKVSLTWDDLRAIEAEIPNIAHVAPLLSARGTQVTGEDANWNTTVYGTTAKWFEIRSWTAAEGQLFDVDTGNSNAKVAVLGKTVATQLFGTRSPVGQVVRISGQPYDVIGVLTTKGQGPMGDNDDAVVIPVKTYEQKLSKGLGKYIGGQILVATKSNDEADSTMQKITSLLRDRHKLDSSDEDDFRVRNPAEFARGQQESTQRIATLLMLVAAASLVVGGIGVMNIMLVSVIERTREIGIRMAVGARPIDVMTQFLVEALVLSAVAGGLGLVLGYFLAQWGAEVYKWKFQFPATIAGIAFAVSGGIGVVFGLYPAVRASQLDPITALRYET